MNRTILFPLAVFALAALNITPGALAGKPKPSVPFEASGLAMYDMPSPFCLDAVLVGDDDAFVGTLSERALYRGLRGATYIVGTVELIFDDEGMSTLKLEIYENRGFPRLFDPMRWMVSDGTGVFAGVEGSGELFWNVLDPELAEFDFIGEIVFP